MLYAQPSMKPGEMPALTGISTDRLKDWHRVGVFDDGEGGSLIGSKQETGRWLYSMSDAVVLATMHSMRNTRLDRKTLLSFARQVERGIQKALGFNVPGGAGLFAVFWFEDWMDVEAGFDCKLTDNPRDIHTVESTTAFLFDLGFIAQHTLPDALILALSPVQQAYNARFAELAGDADG